jgi:hypothetical protein
MRRTATAVLVGVFTVHLGVAHAQAGGPGTPWRGAGPQPCFGIDGGAIQCAAAPGAVAIRAGRLFDSNTGRLLAAQVVLIEGERIIDVGPSNAVRIPAGMRVLDLSAATLLPGLIDAHTHMFNTPKPGHVARDLRFDRSAEHSSRSARRLHDD